MIVTGDGELDVAGVTPDGTPRVLDEPVFHAVVVGTVAYAEDGVIERGATGIAGQDTGSVGLEGTSVSLNGDGEDLLCKSGLHLVGGGGFDLGVIGHTDGGGGGFLVENAGAGSLGVARGVGVDGRNLSVELLEVVEGALLETTVATEVAVSTAGAVNKLLLGEGEELACGNEVSALKSTSGGEGPAGTALSLILDGGDATLFNPVLVVSVGLGEDVGGGLCNSIGGDVSKNGLVLDVGPVGELVVAGGPGGVGGVVLLDEVVGDLEVLDAQGKLLNVGDDLVELGHVVHVVEVRVGGFHGGGDADDGSKNE